MHVAAATPSSSGRRRRNKPRPMHLNIISLIDIFTVLVFFLLLNLTQTEKLPESKDVRLPESSALAETRDAVIVSISRDEILVQGTPVAKVADVLASTEPLIASLHSALDALPQADPAVVVASPATAEPAPRELTVMGDREIPYQLLRKVLATCADAGFEGISLAVLQRATPVAMSSSQPVVSLAPR
ncbi:biopolymer transport protein ExbD [Panacagrimonas perspica]|uniref:Biopolymer transport protein ExbD n=1 Tax=Panacagrimonas perspica TaxID=381431 RepID=A0A4V6RR39_9GAMM|nr:biopolymer transporter ExbD [Panacagrimonas perspica]TDU32027.1 biopolymer transport protein ExbD [Panacagrimonas perspica]THD04441.1 hypothetical protein B1810_05395 [Panacagrimonas perspica]